MRRLVSRSPQRGARERVRSGVRVDVEDNACHVLCVQAGSGDAVGGLDGAVASDFDVQA